MGKYLNGYRRELVLWTLSFQEILDGHKGHLKGKELLWLRSIDLSVKTLAGLMLRGADKTELRAIENVAKNVEPKLYGINTINSEEPTVKVNIDVLYDLAEQAVAQCKFDCNKDYSNCKRRQLFLDLLIPPFVESGPCQYYQD